MRDLSVAMIAAASTLALSQFAAAADLPVKAPPAAVVATSWTGFYVGANGGYAWQDPTVTFTPDDYLSNLVTCSHAAGGTCAQPTSFDIKGGFGGLQVGFNWQVNRNWLVGIEADYDWSHIRGSAVSPNFFMGSSLGGPIGVSSFQVAQKVTSFGTVRARVGYLWTDKVLVFATGGFAYGRVSELAALNSQPTLGFASGGFSIACSTGPNCFLGASSRMHTGWTAGGGFEYAVWHNVSVKAEYLYVNLHDAGGGDSFNVVGQPPTGFPGTAASSFTAAFSETAFHIVRGGLNWRF